MYRDQIITLGVFIIIAYFLLRSHQLRLRDHDKRIEKLERNNTK